jgi:hypothetical protein
MKKKGYEESCWIFALRYYQHRTVNMDLYYILPIPDHVELGVQDTSPAYNDYRIGIIKSSFGPGTPRVVKYLSFILAVGDTEAGGSIPPCGDSIYFFKL